jgi:Uma2 family endonuclease
MALRGALMATTLIIGEQVEIPMDLRSLADFRRWATSDKSPERGRIDYVGGRIEVDMAPEDFFCHGKLKTEIVGKLYDLVEGGRLGHLMIDSTRISSVGGDFSAEPDVVFISHGALEDGRVRLVPKAGRQLGRYVEVEGGPDLVVEVVSDSSVEKDTRRLPAAYFKAGVREFWLADARGKRLLFRIHHRGRRGFQAVAPDARGFQRSSVFGCAFRLAGKRNAEGIWSFDLRRKA